MDDLFAYWPCGTESHAGCGPYGRETSADKCREIVTLLETMAEEDGEGTAGSAVMFLNDLQREAAATGGEEW